MRSRKSYTKFVSVLQQKIIDNNNVLKAKNLSGYDKSPINHIINHKFIINRKTNQDLRRNKVHEENSIKSVGYNQGI